jgi:hypothetical protein
LIVIAGLDPAIHGHFRCVDRRVKPGGDEIKICPASFDHFVGALDE